MRATSAGLLFGIGQWRWGSLDVLQTKRADLVSFQPLVDARPVKAVVAGQPPQNVVFLKLAQTHCTTCLATRVKNLGAELLNGQPIDDVLGCTSRFRSWLGALEARWKGVVEDNEGHKQPGHCGEDDCQGEPVQTRAWLAIGRVQKPYNAQDEPPVGHNGYHLTGFPRRGMSELPHTLLYVSVTSLNLAETQEKDEPHWSLQQL